MCLYVCTPFHCSHSFPSLWFLTKTLSLQISTQEDLLLHVQPPPPPPPMSPKLHSSPPEECQSRMAVLAVPLAAVSLNRPGVVELVLSCTIPLVSRMSSLSGSALLYSFTN